MIYKKLLSKEYKEIYIMIIIILIIRSFIFESFRIPSGSMQPTLLIGDFIFVNKFIYGIDIPIIKKKIKVTNPKRGDIIVFKKDNKINNKNKSIDKKILIKEHMTPKKEYMIKNNSNEIEPIYSYSNIVVPKNSYFFIGDNRDNSYDSRFWGVVEKKQIKGRALIIWLSIDIKEKNIRWNRLLKYIK